VQQRQQAGHGRTQGRHTLFQRDVHAAIAVRRLRDAVPRSHDDLAVLCQARQLALRSEQISWWRGDFGNF
jgi:hypothetical protein